MNNKTPAQVALEEFLRPKSFEVYTAQEADKCNAYRLVRKVLEAQAEKDRVMEMMAEALDKLARLGNAPMMGNSNANVVAQEALAEYQKLFGGE